MRNMAASLDGEHRGFCILYSQPLNDCELSWVGDHTIIHHNDQCPKFSLIFPI